MVFRVNLNLERYAENGGVAIPKLDVAELEKMGDPQFAEKYYEPLTTPRAFDRVQLKNGATVYKYAYDQAQIIYNIQQRMSSMLGPVVGPASTQFLTIDDLAVNVDLRDAVMEDQLRKYAELERKAEAWINQMMNVDFYGENTYVAPIVADMSKEDIMYAYILARDTGFSSIRENYNAYDEGDRAKPFGDFLRSCIGKGEEFFTALNGTELNPTQREKNARQALKARTSEIGLGEMTNIANMPYMTGIMVMSVADYNAHETAANQAWFSNIVANDPYYSEREMANAPVVQQELINWE